MPCNYVEHFISIKECIIGKLAAKARQYYFLPFLSISLDLIQNEVHNKKLIGVRISYGLHGNTYSWNLAVRGYNPLQGQLISKQACEIINGAV
jgi:hypothetical protein